MSWLFFSGGTIMPALIPREVLLAAKTPDIKEAVDRGWDVQIRARLSDHLTWFCENYMPADSYSDEVDVSGTDYNVRRYCSKEALAQGVFNATMDMDYVKFKDTSTRRAADGSYLYGPNSDKYHSVLLSVWSASGRLNAPYGGKDGTARPWSNYMGTGALSGTGTYRGIGSTFGVRADERSTQREWWTETEPEQDDDPYSHYWDTEDEISDLLSLMSDVPVNQWDQHLDEREYALLEPYLDEARAAERKHRRNAKKSKRYRNGGRKNRHRQGF